MKCNLCSAVNDDDAQYCASCGYDLTQSHNPEQWYNIPESSQTLYSEPLEPLKTETRDIQPEVPIVIPAQPVNQEDNKDHKGLALAGFICSLISIPCCIPTAFSIVLSPLSLPLNVLGIIFSIFGIKSSRRKLALAGMIISAIGIIFSIYYGSQCMTFIQGIFSA